MRKAEMSSRSAMTRWLVRTSTALPEANWQPTMSTTVSPSSRLSCRSRMAVRVPKVTSIRANASAMSPRSSFMLSHTDECLAI